MVTENVNKAPLPAPTEPGELLVVPVEVTAYGAKLRLLPRILAMDAAIDRYSNGLWSTSRYSIGGVPYCKLALWDTRLKDWVARDAPSGGEYAGVPGLSRAKADDAGSLYNAMIHWGFWLDIYRLPALSFTAEQLHIVPVQDNNGKVVGARLGQVPQVHLLGRDDAGEINVVQLVDRSGGKIVWQRG